MASCDDEAIITRLREIFGPNIKSRSEAAAVRREIAAAVNSFIVYDKDEGYKPKQIKPFSSEISGLRRRYLNALKTNLEARSHRERLRGPDTSSPLGSTFEIDAGIVTAQLDVLQYSKIHQQLEIRRRYANALRQDLETVCDLASRPVQQREGLNQYDTELLKQSIEVAISHVRHRTLELQKAILQANHQLERQQNLLAELKQGALLDNALVEGDGNRSRAIETTRDALVTWLDEKLSETGGDQTSDLDENQNGTGEGQDKSGLAIEDAYENYLAARRALLSAAEECMRAMPTQVVESAKDEQNVDRPQRTTSDDLLTVHRVSQGLVPLLQSQTNTGLLRSYMSAQASKEYQDTLEILGRLADESHLLPGYQGGIIDGIDEIGRSVQAWTSAAGAARKATETTTEEHKRTIREALASGRDGYSRLELHLQSKKAIAVGKDAIDWRGISGTVQDYSTI